MKKEQESILIHIASIANSLICKENIIDKQNKGKFISKIMERENLERYQKHCSDSNAAKGSDNDVWEDPGKELGSKG